MYWDDGYILNVLSHTQFFLQLHSSEVCTKSVSPPHTSRPIKKCAPYFKCSSLFSSYANSVSKQRPFSKFQNIREPRACALIRCASNRQDSHTLGRMSIFLCGGLGQCIVRDIVIIRYNLCEVMGDHSTIMQLCT